MGMIKTGNLPAISGHRDNIEAVVVVMKLYIVVLLDTVL